MKTRVATVEDFPGWIDLAREVEPLFGPMADVPSFREALRQALAHGDALCIRAGAGGEEPVLHGGIVISREANEILWLAVASGSRGLGIGKALLGEAVGRLDAARPVTVTTFAGSVDAGIPARALYRSFGFEDSLPGGMNPAGLPTVVMVRTDGGRQGGPHD
ncbi:MAG TPA: GNAT family N-acetyltransferase [Deltaproteobacteria bacterium]|nr:GNAT family N-acetyltransferase [Deltaproteobacteria bacterium]HXK48472.1 GNAT family N-acetyltransferase [Deltaproteobacteria bacterium]